MFSCLSLLSCVFSVLLASVSISRVIGCQDSNVTKSILGGTLSTANQTQGI